MTKEELDTLVKRAKQAHEKTNTQGFIGCRGELEGQTGVIIYSFRDAASAAAFQTSRQSVSNQFRLEISDKAPTEVRDYRP